MRMEITYILGKNISLNIEVILGKKNKKMIKFLDIQKINAQYANELKQIVSEVIDSGWYLLGERLKRFEENLAN
jgi:hypothetical protein